MILLLNLLACIVVALIVATLVKHFFFTLPLDGPVEEERIRIAVIGTFPPVFHPFNQRGEWK